MTTTSLQKQLLGTGVAMVGWAAFSYFPKSSPGLHYTKKLSAKSIPYFRSINHHPATMALVDEVVSDINSHQKKPVNRDGIDIYQTNYQFPSTSRHLGYSKTGAMIWLPIGTRDDAAEVFHYHCTVENSKDMEKFCILSRNAKKFLLARQIMYCEDGFSLVCFLTGLGMIGVGSVLHYFIQSTLDLRKEVLLKKVEKKSSALEVDRYRTFLKGLSKRSSMATLFFIALLGIPLYKLIIATYSISSETKTHEKLAALGPDYVEGGVEFYEKVVTGNKYHVTVFGNTEDYLPSGDINQGRFSWLHDSLNVTYKLNYFIKLQEELKQTNT